MKNWQIRQSVLAEPGWDSDVKLGALVIVEQIDWNTNEKELPGGKPHLYNWLAYLGEMYGMSPEQINAGFKKMCSEQYLVIEGKKLILQSPEGELNL